MESKGIRRLAVVQDAQLLGVVTQTDITRGLISLSPLWCVSTIMSTNVATVQAEAAVAEAARIMSSNGISCVLAMHRNEVAGIVSEKDLLKRVVALHKDPAGTSVTDVMSFPVKVIPPNYSILSASNKMDKLRLHRLVVMDGKRLCGIVTQTDIMRAVRSELERLQGQSQLLITELAAVAQRAGHDLEQVHDLLQKVQCSATMGREAAPE
jgi:CBS domain-containing protein